MASRSSPSKCEPMPLLITRRPPWSLDTFCPVDQALVLGGLRHLFDMIWGNDHGFHSEELEGDRGLLRPPKPGVIGPVYKWGFDSWGEGLGRWEFEEHNNQGNMKHEV